MNIWKGIAVGAAVLFTLSMAIFDYPPPLFRATWWQMFWISLMVAWACFVWSIAIDHKLAKLRDELLKELRPTDTGSRPDS